MQATVRTFDPQTRSGDVLLDSGRALEFGAAAFDPSGLRLLRIGQRVRLVLDSSGAIAFLTIATFD
jgi:2-phospho-L-lactate guanylyltransferase